MSERYWGPAPDGTTETNDEYYRRRVKELEQANRNNLDAWANEVGHLHARVKELEDSIRSIRECGWLKGCDECHALLDEVLPEEDDRG